jgi:hypothetical protein
VQNQGKQRSILPFVIALQLPFLVLAACTQAGSSDKASPASTPDTTQASAGSGDRSDPALPKVPFGNQPCQSFSQGEQQHLGLGKPVPGKSSHSPDDLGYDNVCEYSDQTIEYTSRNDYIEQRDHLRSSQHAAPADIPGAFYDVLGNLWFAEKGYYVVLPNNVAAATREKAARVVAAKL